MGNPRRRKPKKDEEGVVIYRRQPSLVKKQIQSFTSVRQFQNFLAEFNHNHPGKQLSDYYSLLHFPSVWASTQKEALFQSLDSLFTSNKMVLQRRLETSPDLLIS